MKIKITIALAVLALGASALVASAQDNNDGPPAGGPGMGGHRPPPPAIIGALDANHDGVIDADEIANASAALKTLDKNGDGKLTRDEYMGTRPQGRPPGGYNESTNSNDGTQVAGGPPQGNEQGEPGMSRHHPPIAAVVKALDANHDGVIDADEIANASAALKTLDKNGDGKLTRDEYMGPRPPRPDRQTGPDGQGQNSGGGEDNNAPSGPPPGN